jgi:hypothetical protein
LTNSPRFWSNTKFGLNTGFIINRRGRRERGERGEKIKGIVKPEFGIRICWLGDG